MNDADTVEMISPLAKGPERSKPYSSLVEVDLGGLSHQGKVRSNNEDHFLITRFGRFLEVMQSNLPTDAVPTRSEETGYGIVVANGMGGMVAGEEASRRAISILINLVLRAPDWILRLDEPLPEEVMRRAAERYGQVNQALEDQARQDPGLRGFGTTMTMAYSLGQELFVVHMGDSRAYLLRQGQLEQLTRDHTLVQELLDGQKITRMEAATHRLRHVLTRFLGDHGREIQPDVTRIALKDGDCLMLCTDGLTDMVTTEAIRAILGSSESAQSICVRLVDRALEAGGKDNVTAVVARYQLP